MHAPLLRPSWRALQILTCLTISICILVAWSLDLTNTQTIPFPISKFRALDLATTNFPFPKLKDIGKGIIKGDGSTQPTSKDSGGVKLKSGVHPIDQLISDAEKAFARTIGTEAKTLADAAKTYRKHRNRHPPPGFDAWYAYATSRGAIIVEDFWDQIYDDLLPLWGVVPHTLRQQAWSLKPKISVRDGEVRVEKHNPDVKLDLWKEMLKELAGEKHVKIPDVDVAVNTNALPGVAVPWEVVDTAVGFCRAIIPPASDTIEEFTGLAGFDEDMANSSFRFEPEWLGPRLTHPQSAMGPRPYWTVVRPACHPKATARVEEIMTDVWHPQGHTSVEHDAVNILPEGWPRKTLNGYVGNWTTAMDPCTHPYIQGLHGAFVAPESMSVSQKLFPLFTGSKFGVNNEIVIPGAGEWNKSSMTSLSEPNTAPQWQEREDKLLYRAPATGGLYNPKTWPRSHRHRFVSMLNSSHIRLAEQALQDENESLRGVPPSGTFRLQSSNPYHITAQSEGKLADWVETWADAAFTTASSFCDTDEQEEEKKKCASSYFSVTTDKEENEEVGKGMYKYTAVIDGSTGDDRGEFINSLLTGTITLRASMFRRWYESRLSAWLHFVPMDNTFVDVYGIMEYFVGAGTSDSSGHKRRRWRRKEDGAGHPAQARKIAEQGKTWAEKVLRREDMLIYMYRLMLEYARVIDDSRERLGWVGDLNVE